MGLTAGCILLSIFFFCLHLTGNSADSDDLHALLKLKTTMIGPQGSGLEDWEYSSNPSAHCSFSGVKCDNGSRVISLNVSFLSLNGIIPSEIGLLNKLVNLTVTNNNLCGELPLEMASLTSLKLLNISNNLFSGNFRVELTNGFTNLEILDVYNNNFSGPLPSEIVNLKKLKHLQLGGNFFSGEIPEVYSKIHSLEYLGLSGNALTGKIPGSLAQLKNLKQLFLGYYNAYEGGIPPEFGSLSSLQLLDMASCNLNGSIPATLGFLKNLHSLFLQVNHLTGTLPPELCGIISLKSLDLSINQLTGEIPETYSELKNLTLINLFKNNLMGPIPAFIGELQNLEVLQVWENNFTFELPANLGRNGKLKYLDITMNHITGLIPRDICKKRRLKTLILMSNFLFGPIPEELGECKSLKKIRIAKNFLNGSIPFGIFNLPFVNMIEFSGNYFSGKLPSEISGDALGILTLSNNLLTGKIPSALRNLKKLQTLSLDLNRFSGEIPEEIFDLPLLTNLNMSSNNLSGKIPNSISQSTSLTSIDLSRNSLSGEIPEGISHLKDLGILNFSRNHLSGEIPNEIRFMTSLTVLDLSENDFSGRIPSGGQFFVFNDTSFSGNPNLCSPHHVFCPSMSIGEESFPRKRATFRSKSPILIVALVLTLSTVTLTLLGTSILRKKKLRQSKAWKLTAFQRINIKAEDVIKCLKEENVVGKGASGIVYRGSMPNGVDVAIKRLLGRNSGPGENGFWAEIQTLGQIRHRNIVRLLGYVTNKDSKLLLYEYMPNGNLGELLHGSKGGHLRWETRYKIALEAARGLCYLHHDCSPLIIHRDVKPSNILLDSDFEAHVADFGLAKFLRDSGSSECMSSVAGSYGYIAPEYSYTLRVDEKSDVYSYGVVLLELITGRKPVGEFGEGVDIVRWVRKTLSELSKPSEESCSLAVIDPRLNGYPLTGVVHLFKIAMMCVAHESCSRPSMRDIVRLLANPTTHTLPSLINL